LISAPVLLCRKEISNKGLKIYIYLDYKGYYAILEVSERANYQEIRRAYRNLARKYHPDRNNSSFAEDMIKKINAAFETLSDEQNRKQYDEMNYYDLITKDDTSSSNPAQTEPFVYEDNLNDGQTNNDDVYKEIPPDPKYNDRNGLEQFITNLLDIPKGRFHIIVEPSLCMAFGGCEKLAPKVFVVDKNRMFNPKAKVESETGEDLESILTAAQTCPTKAIKIIDRYTGEQIFP